jgi:hypothetical protein
MLCLFKQASAILKSCQVSQLFFCFWPGSTQYPKKLISLLTETLQKSIKFASLNAQLTTDAIVFFVRSEQKQHENKLIFKKVVLPLTRVASPNADSN